MKTNLELLKLLKEQFIAMDYFGGLCGLANTLYADKKILTKQEYKRLLYLISLMRPSNSPYQLYYWKPGLQEPRINAIDTLIGMYEHRRT